MNKGLTLQLSHEEVLQLFPLINPEEQEALTGLHYKLQNYLFRHLTIEEMQKLTMPQEH